MNTVTKIVLTGGPCAGKTTSLVRIIEHFTGLGFRVFALPEVPTMFLQAGVNYLTRDKEFFYQAEKATLKFQIEMEDTFMEMAANCGKPAIVICDRGTMDISAYLPSETWQAILDETNNNVIKLRDSRYDAVLHLVTAANGAEQFYTNSNNEFRSETIEQACFLDKKVINAWTGHHHMRIIDNCVDFNQKIHRVLQEVSNVIGAPEPIEVERKYIVEITGEVPNSIESEITQTYLKSEPGTEIRLRKRGWQGNYVYLQTTKKTLADNKFIETERRISPNQYITMLQQADKSRQTIMKIRKNFVWEKQYFELDTYLEPAGMPINILEIEGVRDHAAIKFPPFLKIVEDITGRTEYFNYSMAAKK